MLYVCAFWNKGWSFKGIDQFIDQRKLDKVKETMHEQEHKESSTFCGESKLFFCFKYRLMSFNKEPKKESYPYLSIFGEKNKFSFKSC